MPTSPTKAPRSVTGPFLAILGATGALVGFIAGVGELLGYGLRLVSGRLSERSGEFWPITLFGYVVQMSAVPLLALAPNWQTAGLLIVVERIDKAIRNPPRDVMLSHAAKEIGYGFGFGLHEALDQFGALFGPLLVAFILAGRGSYRTAFATFRTGFWNLDGGGTCPPQFFSYSDPPPAAGG